MPRSITIHPASLGVVFGGICLLSMSQFTTAMPLRVEYLAHPRDMIRIEQGTPYTVPANKILVLTALGDIGIGGSSGGPSININGAPALNLLNPNGTEAARSPSMKPLPLGFTVAAGSLVEVVWAGAAPNGRAWGYLVNQ